LKRIFLAVLLFHYTALPAVAQSGVGSITGAVQDSTGAVLPGVAITLINPGTVGGEQSVISDARGVYQFTRLVPGTYGVKAVLSGFQTAIREGIIVNADVTARIDISLKLGDLEETLTVSGAAPLVDTSSALNQQSVDRALLQALPSNIDVWAIARSVPGVVTQKYDVGGTAGYNQYDAVVHGAQGDERAWTIDGMEMGNGNTASSAGMYFDPFGFEETNYQAGNAPAESSRGGVVYNMVTKTGTNTFHYDFTVSGTNNNFQFENLTPGLIDQFRAVVPARVLAANPGFVPSVKLQDMFNTSATFAGPVVRDRLWFAVTGDYGYLNQYQLGTYNADGTRAIEDLRRHSYSEKVSWQVSQHHQLHFYDLFVQKDQLHRITGGDLSTFWESRAANYQYPNAKRLDQVRWTGVLSAKALAEFGASYMRGPMINLNRPEVKPGDIPVFDRVTLVNSVARGTYNSHPTSRTNVRSSLSYSAGTHDLKFGYELNRGYTDFHWFSMSDFPSGLRAIFANGVPDSVNTYNTPVDYSEWEMSQGIYGEDKWRLTSKLVLNYGLRFEKMTGDVPAACQAQTIFVTGRCFPEIKGLPNFSNFAPRFTLIYDVFGNGNTALKFSANRYYPILDASFQDRVNPLKLVSDTRTWTDTNGDKIPQLNELGPSSGFNFGTTNRYSTDLKRPLSYELSVVFDRQLPHKMGLAIGLFHRERRNNIGSRNLAVPTDSYTPIQVTERISGEQVTVYNQASALRGRFDTLWDNAPEMNTDFNGIDLTIRKRMSKRWMLLGGGSFGRYTGDIFGESADLNNPNFTYRHGVLSANVPAMFKMSGQYDIPRGIAVSASFISSSGFPQQQTVSVGRDTLTLTQVTQSLVISPAGTVSLPTVNLMDVTFKKAFKVRTAMKVEPVFGIYNLFNVNTVTNQSAQLGPTYFRANEIVRGRLLKFALNSSF
jgi:hypothetical protein